MARTTDPADRRRRILDAARARADAEGWDAVTTRHLAGAIGFTQPVLYGHFPRGKAEIIHAVALEGFTDLARDCRAAMASSPDRPLEAVAEAYLDFGGRHPAVYEAMFHQPIDARFAQDDVETPLRDAFDVLAQALGDTGDGTETEVLWSTLHGLGLLERAGRMRPDHRGHRIAEIRRRFGPH